MITLKHLTVENFRLLREINLHFPQRGSILIQGPNEAGKSTLFECMYFALYGMSPVPEQRRRTLDDLIFYGAKRATVTLTLSVGVTELTVMRTIERGQGQQVILSIHRLGMPEESPITDVSSANERIIAELGRMDGETLRNSCFVEQKGLGRLEILHGSEREVTIYKLLGLEKLIRLAAMFKVTEHDRQLLAESAERLRLAEMQARIPELSAQLGHIEAALDAIAVSDDLAEISQQEAEIAEQDLSLEHLNTKRHELKNKQARIQQLKKADTILGEIIAAYDAMAEAQRELPELEQQIAELERREREELPTLEKRVYELEDLHQSFGTLVRLADDLQTVAKLIEQLEREHQEQQLQVTLEDPEGLEEQIAHAHAQIEQIQQTQRELEELQGSERPGLQARLPRLKQLSELLMTFRRAQEQYAQRISQEKTAEEHKSQLIKVQKELSETEQELALVEAEAQQVQQRSDAIEKHWRQLSIRRQLEEWQRLKGLSQGLVEAERHVLAAHQQQEQLTQEVLAARRTTTMRMGLLIAFAVLTLGFGGSAAFQALNQSYVIATVLGMVALLTIAGIGWSLQNYSKARENVRIAEQQMQQATNQVSMMVAAREAAGRMGGKQDALMQVEHEISSLGGVVPQSVEQVNQLLEQMPEQSESLADTQQQMTKLRSDVLAARNQVNVTIEAVAGLRKECTRLEELCKQDDADQAQTRHGRTEGHVPTDKTALESIYQEIVVLARQENLPVGTLNTLVETETGVPQEGLKELESLVDAAIKDTERGLVTINAKLEVVPDITRQIKVCQEALDALLKRKRVMTERHERFKTYNPTQQIEQARKQQATLRDALRNLQDSLRQRVQPLGIPFGQTAVHNAEMTARKQLELLHIMLDRRVELQNRRLTYLASLKKHQESLSDYYRQLAKFSSSLGSWVVPLNPFAEALVGLRARCQQEMQEADEDGIMHELEELQHQEGASRAKIALCRRDIDEAQDRIAAMLERHNRPVVKGFTFAEIVAVWPLVGVYTSQDRNRLQEEHIVTEQELRRLEQQELDLSKRLQLGDTKLDLEQTRLRKELLERNCQTKERGGLMVKALNERLVRKVLPRTERYLQQLIPLLTCGRYRDVRLITDPEEGSITGGPFQVRVWESAAGEYLPKSALSGGTADQLSLALRLAFSIATLPGELALAPGFMLLDEPFSSLDQAHTQALVDIVTGEALGQHFEQVLFVSHSSAFDPALFPYHIYMDSGLVVSSNLPTPPVELNGANRNGVSVPIPAAVTQE
jgi:DNA repair exonuclease SbcCD ATPase subunit